MRPLIPLITVAALLIISTRRAEASAHRRVIDALLIPLKLAIGNSMENNHYANQYPHKRGIRNNNPGNIDKGPKWIGLADEQPDSRFSSFTAPEYGIRAMGRLLNNYQRLYGINTVSGLINRWAPDSENNTLAYVHHVADTLGVEPHQPITVADHLEPLVKVIIQHENGVQPYPDDLIRDGLAMV